MWQRLLAQFTTPTNVPKLQANNVVGDIITIVYWAIGITSVILLIVGGLKYVTSGGDPKGTQNAKDTIMYALVGLVVSLLAFAITNFVLQGVA